MEKIVKNYHQILAEAWNFSWILGHRDYSHRKAEDACLDEESESHGILSTSPVRLDINLLLADHFWVSV